jgi:DNA/RNA endonuclease YhcR with UshA esterase domain
MTRTGSIGIFVGALVFAAAAPLLAHHSLSAEFDVNKKITFKGVVKEVDWRNPHIYTHVEVKNPDGTTVVYKVEGGPPNALFRQGWRKDTVKAGDVVEVTGLKAKSTTSTNVGQATITMADGRRIYAQGQRAGGGGQ